MLLTGCVEQLQLPTQQAEPVTLFNREYYEVKNLTKTDIKKMQMLMASKDKSAARTAGLILGRHYVRNGELDRGYKLLKANLDDSYLDRFTRINGHLWMYDAAIKKNDMETADKEVKYLKGVKMDAKAKKAFNLYCAQEDKVIKNGDLKSCVTAEPPAGETDAGVQIFTEPKKVNEAKEKAKPQLEKIVVNVKSADKEPQLVDAMLYSIGKLGVDVDLDFTGKEKNYDYTLDLETKIITSKTNLFEFGYNMKKTFEEAVNLAMLNGGINLVLGYTPELYEDAVEIENKYKDDPDIKIYKFDVTDPHFQASLKTIKEQAGDDATLSFAVGGSEQQLTKVVPFLRFYSDKPDRTVIACAVPGLGKLFFNPAYADYFRGAYVVTDVLMLGNHNVEEFNQEYYNDYQKLPTLNDMLGYDLIVFMEKLKNKSFTADYLTGIKSVDEGRTVRDIEAYRIVSSDKLLKLIY